MRSETRRYRPHTTPGVALNALSFAIVGVVVLVNSVAWGIPLLTGADRSGPILNANHPDPITTGTIPRPERRDREPARAKSPVPLPVLSPSNVPEPAQPAASQRTETPKTTPRTLYPLPEPAPAQLLVPPSKPAKSAPETRITRIVTAPTYAWRDTALVSPYAPGVRIEPSQKTAPPAVRSTPENYDVSRDTTLDRARAIARRAAERFEAMRARLDAPERMRQAGLSAQTLPLSARRPTASLIGSTSASKSAVAFVRPRIVRRPIEPSTVNMESSPATVAAVPVEPRQSTPKREVAAIERAAPSTARSKSAVSVPVPTAHHRPIRTASLGERGPAAEHSASRPTERRAKPKRSARRIPSQAGLNARRLKRTTTSPKSRNRRVASRRRPRKIDGFRPGFHRQLARIGFFGGQR